MKTNKKILMLIVAVLVIAIAVMAIVLVTGNQGADGNADKTAENNAAVAAPETVHYARNVAENGMEIKATATQNGDFYTMNWAERRDIVTGSYDEATGTMENWGEEIPLCDAGLTGEANEWYVGDTDLYGYYDSDHDAAYCCRFNRADKTYERWIRGDDANMAFIRLELDGYQLVSWFRDMESEGGVVAFKDGACYESESSIARYEKIEVDGKVAYDVDGFKGPMEVAGDELTFSGITLKKEREGVYIHSDEKMWAAICFLPDNWVMVCGGRGRLEDDPINGCTINYQPGKLLEISDDGKIFGCTVVGDELVINTKEPSGATDRMVEYRLNRVSK